MFSHRLFHLLLSAVGLAFGAHANAIQSVHLRHAGVQVSQSNEPKPANPAAPTNQQSTSAEVQTEKIDAPPTKQAIPVALSEAGSMRAEDVKGLLKNVRFSEYRINDLLADVHPERWQLAAATFDSFNQTLKALRAQTVALEEWRAQFEQRTDSIYLGFETYAAIDAVLPRLNGVAESVREHEGAGYAAQFSQVGDQLFDLHQTIGTYVGSLLHNQDQLILALENNVGACQQNLSAAMRGNAQRAKPMKNARVGRPERRSSHSAATKPVGSGSQPEAAKKPQ